MALNTEIELFFRKEGSSIVQSLKEGMDRQKRAGSDSNASGKLRNSIKSVVLNKGNVIENHIRALNHWIFVDKGRKKGKFPPKQAIETWVREKGISSNIDKRSLVFLISRKIAQRGIPPTRIFSDVFAEVFKTMPDKLVKELAKKQVREFKISLTK